MFLYLKAVKAALAISLASCSYGAPIPTYLMFYPVSLSHVNLILKPARNLEGPGKSGPSQSYLL